MRVVPGPSGWPEAYEYRVGDRAMRFRQDAGEGRRPILHMSLSAERPLRHEPDRGGGDGDRPAQRGLEMEQGAARQRRAAGNRQ